MTPALVNQLSPRLFIPCINSPTRLHKSSATWEEVGTKFFPLEFQKARQFSKLSEPDSLSVWLKTNNSLRGFGLFIQVLS
jgi:hypothetical protein